jgi:molybdate transport system ATP-binding protein
LSLVVSGARVTRDAFTLDASFETPAEGITAVFGPSGAGKSMLLSVIAGLTKTEAGSILLDGEPLDGVPAYRRDIGVVFQEARLFPHLTVRGNLAYARKRVPEGRHAPEIEEIAQRLDIAELIDRPVRNLSGGEKGRVALARALLAAPKMLLLDEPFAALDGKRRRAFLAMLREVNAQSRLPMMVVTHQIEDAAELADHLVAMKDGRVIAQGGAAQAMRDPAFLALLDQRDVGVRLHPAAVSASSEAQGRGIWVRADNVLVAAAKPQGLSARNVWEGVVSAIRQEDDSSIIVSLDTQAGYILARITPAACAELALKPGGKAWAVVKTYAI